MIVIAGPQRTAALVEQLASTFAKEGLAVRHHVGSDLPSIPSIADTTLLVCIAVPCGAQEMDSMPLLRGIVSPIVGYDWIDVQEATRRAILVANGEVAENRESMAEATIMLLLALLYRLHDTEALLRQSHPGPAPHRRMLKGRTIGIIGSGGIARAILRRLTPWEAALQVFTRATSPELPGARLVGLDELLTTSDVVIVMTSLDPGTRHLLDGERLNRLKPGALLINTSRGGLIEETALIDALASGRVAGAALDVFEVEPLAPDHPLRRLPNVILTPHSVGHTVEMHAAIPRRAIANTRALLSGELPDSCRNPAVLARWSGGLA